MFTLFGLIGILMAGAAADAILSLQGAADTDEGDEPPSDDAASLSDGNLLDDLADEPVDQGGIALSNDLEDRVDAPETVTGGPGDDILSGLEGNDQIDGQAGNDLIDGRGGDDLIDAGTENDWVSAGAGDDTVIGGAGNDTLLGLDGDDSLDSGGGDDDLAGGLGHDTLTGGEGQDTLVAGEGKDALAGGDGNDWLAGGGGDDRLDGGDGSDVLDGGAGNDWITGLNGPVDDFETDYLNGGVGDDQLLLGSGDIAYGDAGSDEFVLQEWMLEGDVAQIADYDAALDKIIVVYDPAAHPEPVLTLEPAADGSGTTVKLDGVPVALVRGGSLSVADVGLSAA